MAQRDLYKGTKEMNFINAKEMRKQMTEAENVLWNILRNRKFKGLKFRRQHPLLNYIVDFYCHEKKCIVEVDGKYHFADSQKLKDSLRNIEIEGENIRVIRFSNEEVLCDIEKVLTKLSEFLNV